MCMLPETPGGVRNTTFCDHKVFFPGIYLLRRAARVHSATFDDIQIVICIKLFPRFPPIFFPLFPTFFEYPSMALSGHRVF